MNNGTDNARNVLVKYLKDLIWKYSQLLKILNLESEDIENSDEFSLSRHTDLETQTASDVISITRSVYTYIEKIQPDEDINELLQQAKALKKEAVEKSAENIAALEGELTHLKSRLAENKLPATSRRVFYAGKPPVILDLEI